MMTLGCSCWVQSVIGKAVCYLVSNWNVSTRRKSLQHYSHGRVYKKIFTKIDPKLPIRRFDCRNQTARLYLCTNLEVLQFWRGLQVRFACIPLSDNFWRSQRQLKAIICSLAATFLVFSFSFPLSPLLQCPFLWVCKYRTPVHNGL